jgi:hypothetical protein
MNGELPTEKKWKNESFLKFCCWQGGTPFKYILSLNTLTFSAYTLVLSTLVLEFTTECG